VWSEFAKQCGVEATPTLVALIDGNIVAKMAGSQDMTSTFWQTTINNHKK
jgi:thioredoxin-like negative regulator of GroEL